jgi:hypothetical protein
MLPATVPTLNRLLRELMQSVRKGFEVREMGLQRYRLCPGQSLEHQCCAPLLPSTVRLKLDSFRQQFNAQRVTAEYDRHVYQVRLSGSFWQRLAGNVPGMEAELRFRYPRPGLSLARINITIRPINCDSFRAADLLDELGLKLLESLRGCLQSYPERRQHERMVFEQTITIFPMGPGGRMGDPIAAKTRDLSLTGIGLLLTDPLPTREICLELRAPSNPNQSLAVPGRVVWCERNGEGFFEAGVCFTVQES